MKRKEVFRMLRPRFSRLGLILLAYYGIMNAAVSLVLGLDILGLILDGVFTNNTGSFSIEKHIGPLVSSADMQDHPAPVKALGQHKAAVVAQQASFVIMPADA